MNISVSLGTLAAIIFLSCLIGMGIYRRFHRLTYRLFNITRLAKVFSQLDQDAENTPRSLNGCDSLLMPKILQDFPDFDQNLAKTYARKNLSDRFRDKPDFTIHKIVIAQYLRSSVQKCIVFQAAVSWKENEKVMQKRYDLHYSYILHSQEPSVAANCPNCGGALQLGATHCPYCNCRIVNVLGNTWAFTQLTES